MKFLLICLGAWLAAADVVPLSEKAYENHVTDRHGLTDPFPANYLSAREEFRLLGQEAEKKLKAQLGSYAIANRRKDDLTIDYLFIPSAKKNSKLLILSSGIHGASSGKRA